MDTVKKNEVLLRNKDNWLYFADPHEIIVAESLEEVPGALRSVERLIEAHQWHAAGFISYEAAPAFEPVLPSRPTDGFPYLWFGLYSQPQLVRLPKPNHPKPVLDWQPTVDRKTYTVAIDRIREYIATGRTYQVNYTLHLQTDFETDAWEFFLHLANYQNEHAAYLDTGRYAICSASPELFFQLDGNVITCRPMKGTVRRGRTSHEDRIQADWLKNSEKNQAENVMIVDMIRNDLGRIATTGSVRVPMLFQVERYPTLWQMTSTITAHTKASLSEIVFALSPCASITGAPKVSTMRIIHELENRPRGIYTGTIGYISPSRKASFNVAIRTALIDRQKRKADYGIGGGIVWDSTSADEYAEALLKARALTERQPDFSLLETIFWSPQEGYFLKEKHIERLLDSASYFGFPASAEKIEEKLAHLSSSFHLPVRVRLLLDRGGSLEAEYIPISPEKQPIQARLAVEPVDSRDTFLFHKTTHREVYDRARASQPDYEDVLLHNERGELTEFTIGNLIVEMDGAWITPPIECGLLPGTFRSHLLETGRVLERTVPLPRLKDCTKIYRINAVRKWETVIIS